MCCFDECELFVALMCVEILLEVRPQRGIGLEFRRGGGQTKDYESFSFFIISFFLIHFFKIDHDPSSS